MSLGARSCKMVDPVHCGAGQVMQPDRLKASRKADVCAGELCCTVTRCSI